jgi:hypothetical protein
LVVHCKEQSPLHECKGLCSLHSFTQMMNEDS